MLPRLRVVAALPDLAVLAMGALTLVSQLLVNAGQLPPVVVRGLTATLVCMVLGWAFACRRFGLRRLLLWLSDPAVPPRPAATVEPSGGGSTAVRAVMGVCVAWALWDYGAAGNLVRFVGVAAVLCLFMGLLEIARPSGAPASEMCVDETPNTARMPALDVERWILGVLCVACVGIVLCVSRPDKDEAFYLALASSMLREPGLPTFSFDPVHGVLDWPLQVATYRAHSYEVFAGSLAWLTGLRPIYWSHLVLPGLAAALLPLAWRRLMAELWLRRATLATALTLILLLLDGSSHQSYGNFALVRLYQGKAILLSVVLPLVLAYAIRFAKQPSAARFLLLVASQVAATGASSTAIPVAPIVGGLGLVAGLPGRAMLRRLGLGLAGCAYPIALGGFFYGQMLGARGVQRLTETAGDAVEQATALVAPAATSVLPLEEAFRRVLSDAPVRWAYLAALLLLPLLAPGRTLRRLAAASGLLFFAVLANPQLTDLVAGHLFGQSTYWRVFWVLPLPAYLALCCLTVARAAIDKFGLRHGVGQRGAPTWVLPALSTALVVAVGVSLPGHAVWAQRNRADVGWPRPKVSARAFQVAARASALAPSGTSVVAPRRIAVYLGAFRKPVYAVFAKKSYLKPRHRKARARLARCVTRLRCPTAWLKKALRRFPIGAAVVVDAPSPTGEPPDAALRQTGFVLSDRADGYRIWTRRRSRMDGLSP